jgi:hypothetical protein
MSLNDVGVFIRLQSFDEPLFVYMLMGDLQVCCWVSSGVGYPQVSCQICGDGGHPTIDRPQKHFGTDLG